MTRVRLRRRRAAPSEAAEPLFCRLPFTEVCIDEAGDVWPNCCPDWVEFPLGNLLEQSWDEVWNGRRAQELRRSVHDGSLRHCDAGWCPHLQTAQGGPGDHIVAPYGERARLDLPDEALAGAVEMATGPTNVGMHYEPSCNLACPTCRSDIEMVSGDAAERMRRLHDTVETEVLPHPRIISMTGTGDPFASRFLREFLIGFDRDRFPGIETIHLHTNAILWTPALWARMTGLHDIDVTTDISIDAARPATYELVRRPARWERLVDNLAFIGTIPNVRSIGVSMTVSQPNVGELVEFHDLGRRLAERSDRFTFVEYKRVRRRMHHDDDAWRAMGLEHLGAADGELLVAQLAALEERRRAGAEPEIRSNLAEFADVADPAG